MFFVGSLSTILPYAATLVVMAVYFIAGHTNNINIPFSESQDEKVIACQQSDLSDDESTIAYDIVNCELQAALDKLPLFDNILTVGFPQSSSAPCSILATANGNKAPPALL